MIDVCIIGAGHMGLRMLENAKSLALNTLLFDKAALSDTPDALYSGQVRTMFKNMGNPKLYIATPDAYHHFWFNALAAPGMDVCVEKPVCLDRTELDHMIFRYHRGRVNLTTNLPWRVSPQYLTLIANPQPHANIKWVRDKSWGYRNITAHVVHDIGPHVFDLMFQVLGMKKQMQVIHRCPTYFEGIYGDSEIIISTEGDTSGFTIGDVDFCSPVIPEEYMNQSQREWLIGNSPSRPTIIDIVVIHELIFNIMEGKCDKN